MAAAFAADGETDPYLDDSAAVLMNDRRNLLRLDLTAPSLA